jgi:predicted enzyme related to lactoylglutathione lyase
MFLKLNWIGIHVADFQTSLRFYTEVLGIRASDTKPDWAYMETMGMVFELFGDSQQPALDQSTWGHGQPVRPSIQVVDLHETVATLRQRGVQFIGDVEQILIGEMIEFIAPENLRWTLVQAPDHPASTTLNKPHIGWLELKVDRLAEQKWF